MGVDLLQGKTLYVDGTPQSSISNICDDSLDTVYYSSDAGYPHWVAVDMGAGVTKIATSTFLVLRQYDSQGMQIKDFKIQGSNDSTNGSDGTWTDLLTAQTANSSAIQKFTFSNTTGYRWYRLYVTSRWDWYTGDNYISCRKWELYDDDLCNILPFMTADNAPSPYALSSSFTPDGTPIYKGFDDVWDNYLSCVATKNTSGIVTIDLGLNNEKAIKTYSIMPQATYGVEKAPKDWTFQGSNNGTNWDTLDTHTGVTTWSLNVFKYFSFTNDTAYRYYRLNCTANNGDSTYFGFDVMQLFGSVTEEEPVISEGIFFAAFM